LAGRLRRRGNIGEFQGRWIDHLPLLQAGGEVSLVLEEFQTVSFLPTFDGSSEKGKHVRLSEGRTSSPGGKKTLGCAEVLIELLEHIGLKVCMKAVNEQCVQSLQDWVE
jgi:hypothetical protein